MFSTSRQLGLGLGTVHEIRVACLLVVLMLECLLTFAAMACCHRLFPRFIEAQLARQLCTMELSPRPSSKNDALYISHRGSAASMATKTVAGSRLLSVFLAPSSFTSAELGPNLSLGPAGFESVLKKAGPTAFYCNYNLNLRYSVM